MSTKTTGRYNTQQLHKEQYRERIISTAIRMKTKKKSKTGTKQTLLSIVGCTTNVCIHLQEIAVEDHAEHDVPSARLEPGR